MAKSARASVRKRNNAKLRSTVFGPATDARTERLSAKLQQLASQAGPAQKRKDANMDADIEERSSEEAIAESADSGVDVMDVDVDGSHKNRNNDSTGTKRKASKNEKKKLKRKAKNSIVFRKSTQSSGKHRVSKRR